MSKAPSARIYRGTARNLKFLAERLRDGELVGVPTETVYGLAANALDAKACRKIFRAKGRPLNDPLIVHLHSVTQLRLICAPNAVALKLAKRFWPGPLTLVLPKLERVPAIVSSGHPSIAVRIPSHALFRQLLKLSQLPLAAPSANPFGYVSPTTAEHVRHGIGRKIRYILDGGAARIGLESTIVDLRNPAKPRILRPGAVTREALEKTLGRPMLVARPVTQASRTGDAPLAPGMLARHYSPQTPVELHRKMRAADKPRHAYVFLRKPDGQRRRNVFWLDKRGDLRGVARRLFATLRALDDRHFETIHVELASGDGLAVAINDRLRRAAAR